MGITDDIDIEIEWDAQPGVDPGWVVRTKTAGWQPVEGDLNSPWLDLAEQARRVIAYHDNAGPFPY